LYFADGNGYVFVIEIVDFGTGFGSAGQPTEGIMGGLNSGSDFSNDGNAQGYPQPGNDPRATIKAEALVQWQVNLATVQALLSLHMRTAKAMVNMATFEASISVATVNSPSNSAPRCLRPA
jgi:hypothetical protein